MMPFATRLVAHCASLNHPVMVRGSPSPSASLATTPMVAVPAELENAVIPNTSVSTTGRNIDPPFV
jgi:hypothetical protein